jgi:Na+-transporting methylmalonyl-CoA/oxaloacetate decarboxylase gamma subunit
MENLNWGLQMTVLGMGLVFTLLAFLWLLLTVVLKLDKEEEEEPAQETSAQEPVEAAAPAEAVEASPGLPMVNGLPADLVAAILVATHKHRQTLRRQAAPLVRAVWPGSQLFASRWLAAGRTRQTHNWQPRGR